MIEGDRRKNKVATDILSRRPMIQKVAIRKKFVFSGRKTPPAMRIPMRPDGLQPLSNERWRHPPGEISDLISYRGGASEIGVILTAN
jgi:hypothetical protein